MNRDTIRLKIKERIMYILIYTLIVIAAAWLFYDSVPAAIVFLPFFFPFISTVKGHKAKKRQEELTDGFLRSLISVSTSLSAGLSPENAFACAASDMEKLYGKDAPIVKELDIMNSHVTTGERIQDALYDFARRAAIPEIYDFAVVFSVAKEKGADFSSVISTCVSIMETKRRAEVEAHVMIRAKQYEQRVMCIIPPGILLYLKLSSGSFIGILYHNVRGIMIMSGCLLVYVAAVCLSERIGDVKV